MRKSLLTLGLALCGAGLAVAQSTIYEGLSFNSVSPNGNWLGHNMENAAFLMDRSTGNTWYFVDDSAYVGSYFIGYGHSVTNEGMFVGAVQEANENAMWGSYADAAYFKNGVWTKLPQLSGRENGVNSANAVTPDEWRMCGAQGPQGANFGKDELMLYPAVWTKNANGEYEVQALPYPEKDFTGRAPQYITAMDISADGKTIVGQVMDCSGYYCYPILYKQNESGEWSYQLFATDLVWDASRLGELPELGEQPTSPNVDEYLSEEDYARYVEAYNYYYECLDKCYSGDMSWDELPPYPSKSEYISDEEKAAAYNAALDAYNVANNAWYEAFVAFDEKLAEITTGASFMFNSVNLSPNGKYALLDLTTPDPDGDPMAWTPEMLYKNMVFDLTSDSLSYTTTNTDDKLSNSIYNDGMFVVCSPANDYTRNSYVGFVGKEDVVPVEDFLAAAGDSAAVSFLNESCVFDKVEYVWNDPTGMYDELTVPGVLVTGTGLFSAEGNTYVSWYQNPTNNAICTMVIDLAQSVSGIESATAADSEATVIRREYYNLQGQRIAAPQTGLYLEKTVTNKGIITKKCLKK